MTEMIERVARALFDIEWDAVHGDGWDKQDQVAKEYWFTSARAAIEAMREPTDSQIAAGAVAGVEQMYHKAGAWLSCVGEDVREDWFNAHKFGWQAMITAALTEAT